MRKIGSETVRECPCEYAFRYKRTVYAQVPPKVEYRLTALGETLLPVLEALYAWGAKTREAASRTRTRFTNSIANAGGSKSPRHSVPVESTAETCP
jgi:hypothetical protein